jgi:hypothetical protein
MTDLKIQCNDGLTVKCHSIIVCAFCKYFKNLLISDIKTKETESKTIEFTLVNSTQMELILKFMYTKEFDVKLDDVISIWIMSDKLYLNDLQTECESLIEKNINNEIVGDLIKIAESINSKRIIESCKTFLNK